VLTRTAAALAVALNAHLLLAQTPHQTSALRGLRAVHVTVNFQAALAAYAGAVDTSFLRRQVELEVGQTGIAMIGPGTNAPQLSLSVTVLSRPESGCRPDSVLHWYTYRLELRQWAQITQRPPAFVWATTWGQGGVGFSHGSHIGSEIMLSAHQLMQTFVNEFRADNPARE